MKPAAGRIVFAGSPDFALPTLEQLLRSPHQLIAVLTQPDRPAGRGRRLTASPVKRRAAAEGIPLLQPDSLRQAGIQQQLRELAPDLIVVVAYGLLLPSAVLAIPRRGCINVHASLLPRWRGAAPVQAAILAGDAETGVSIMALDEGLDTGPVYASRRLRIGPEESAGELAARLARLGAATLGEVLDGVLKGSLTPQPQPAAGITRTTRISKADARIDWTRSALEIGRLIRAYNPWPVAETLLQGQRLRCWSARVLDGTSASAPPGLIVAAGPEGVDVATGSGLLRLTELQPPGRPVMTAGAFASGRDLSGAVLGP